MRNIAPQDASELEALEQREWLESLDYVIQQGDRGRVQRLLAALRHHARMAGVALPFTAVTAYVNTHPRRRADAAARAARRSSAASRASSAGTRWRWSSAPTGSRTASAATSRPTPRPRRSTKSASTTSSAARKRRRRRHHLLPGARLAGHLCARVPRGADLGRAAAELPPRAGRRRRPVVVSASVADAGLLGVPDGLDGARPDHGDLPGALPPLPRGSRPEEAVDRRRSGRSSATARPTSPRRSARSAWRRARSSTT